VTCLLNHRIPQFLLVDLLVHLVVEWGADVQLFAESAEDGDGSHHPVASAADDDASTHVGLIDVLSVLGAYLRLHLRNRLEPPPHALPGAVAHAVDVATPSWNNFSENHVSKTQWTRSAPSPPKSSPSFNLPVAGPLLSAVCHHE
jgi:hypothetical protein